MGITQPVSGGDGTSGTKVSPFFLLQNKWSGDEKLSASLKKKNLLFNIATVLECDQMKAVELYS